VRRAVDSQRNDVNLEPHREALKQPSDNVRGPPPLQSALCRVRRLRSGAAFLQPSCASSFRRSSLRRAGRQYQATDRGRSLHAARQARYRDRLRAVTHQSRDADLQISSNAEKSAVLQVDAAPVSGTAKVSECPRAATHEPGGSPFWRRRTAPSSRPKLHADSSAVRSSCRRRLFGLPRTLVVEPSLEFAPGVIEVGASALPAPRSSAVTRPDARGPDAGLRIAVASAGDQRGSVSTR